MQDLTVGLVQFDQYWEAPKRNYAKITSLMEKSQNSMDLVLLPEMFETGFSMNTQLCSEAWIDSEGLDFLKHLSRDYNTALYTSMMAKTETGFVNRGVLVEQDGKVSIYDKRHLFALGGEKAAFEAGRDEVIVSVKGWNLMLQICFDLRFPEASRNQVMADGSFRYDALLYVANWPAKRIDHWNVLLSARALENQAFVCAVNRTGMDGNNLAYNGHSALYSPEGSVLGSLGDVNEGILSLTLSQSLLCESRKNLPFLKERLG
ncbi:MAG: nitrilase-related carbon-nitrogen hydrolase [Crocinitomicaceae bacterium]|jgi:predicted amidohydrolase